MATLADMLGYGSNPLYMALAPKRNTIAGLGVGLLSGRNWQQGLANAGQYAMQGSAADQAYQDKLAERKQQEEQNNLTAQWLAKNYPDLAGLPPAEGFALATKMFGQQAAPVDPTETSAGRQQLAQQYGLTGADLTNYVLTGRLPGGNQSVRAGVGQPIYGKNKQTGAIEPWQSMSDGTMVNIANPNADPSQYDFNPGISASERTGATVDAKTAGAARAALPGAQQAVEIANKATDALLNDTQGMAEQFGSTLGVPNQMVPWAMPGSAMARFRTELAQGQGNAFMQARQMLKGGGQITDFEGAKAEAAFSRMQLAAQNNNQQEFIAAVQDFRDAVNSGYQKLLAAAQGGYSAPNVAGQGASPAGQTSGGVTWKVLP